MCLGWREWGGGEEGESGGCSLALIRYRCRPLTHEADLRGDAACVLYGSAVSP